MFEAGFRKCLSYNPLSDVLGASEQLHTNSLIDKLVGKGPEKIFEIISGILATYVYVNGPEITGLQVEEQPVGERVACLKDRVTGIQADIQREVAFKERADIHDLRSFFGADGRILESRSHTHPPER
jgi:hypothetical protein